MESATINAKFTVPSLDVQAGTSGTITLKAQAVAVPNELIKASTDRKSVVRERVSMLV